MKLADEIFLKHSPAEETLEPYGFHKENGIYTYSRPIRNGEFDLQITVQNKRINARLIEREFDEEYAMINVDSSGGFIASLKEECRSVLLDIRDQCFRKEDFYFAQTNRIAALIKEKYQIEAEKDSIGFGIKGLFRNPETQKWIALVMYGKKSNLTGEPEGDEKKIEYLGLNFKEKAESFNRQGIYHPYRKNNRNWIAVMMDDSFSDREIMDLIEISYGYSAERGDTRARSLRRKDH